MLLATTLITIATHHGEKELNHEKSSLHRGGRLKMAIAVIKELINAFTIT
jgi:hypothetical protein